MENRHEENRERLLREIGEGKPYAVGVAGYSCWFFFDYYENVVWFMELCAEDGKACSAFSRNELGQYERIAWCRPDEV